MSPASDNNFDYTADPLLKPSSFINRTMASTETLTGDSVGKVNGGIRGINGVSPVLYVDNPDNLVYETPIPLNYALPAKIPSRGSRKKQPEIVEVKENENETVAVTEKKRKKENANEKENKKRKEKEKGKEKEKETKEKEKEKEKVKEKEKEKKEKVKSPTTAVAAAAVSDWLPEGWTVENRVRLSGATAGSRDKYYRDPVSGFKFRSRKEVLHFLETGKRQKTAAESPARPKSETKKEKLVSPAKPKSEKKKEKLESPAKPKSEKKKENLSKGG